MRILFIIHAFPPGSSGGTETYTRDVAAAVAATPGNRVTVVAREADTNRPQYSVRREMQSDVEVFRINNTFEACASFEETYTNPALLHVVEDLVESIDPDVAHIQHLTCLSIGVTKVLRDRGIPVVMTLHDYWMICHRGQLFDVDGRRCAGPGDRGCDRCLPAVSAAGPASWRAGRALRNLNVPGTAAAVRAVMRAADRAMPPQGTRAASLERLAQMRAAASHVDLFLAPSQTIAEHFQTFGVAPSRIRRRSQGVDLTQFRRGEMQPSSTLRIGFAGAFLPTKAPHILLEAVRMLPSGSATVDLIGDGTTYHGDDSYRQVLAPLLGLSFVRRVGPAPHERMPARLRDLDVLVVPSIWIENAPIVIQEAFALGVPVVASNLGGMAEAVAHERNGLLFDAGSPESLAAQLRRLLDDPGLLDRLRAGITPPRSLDDDVAELMEIYEHLARGRTHEFRRGKPHDTAGVQRAPVIPAPRVTAIVLNYNTPDATWLAVRSLQTCFNPPDRILVVDNGSTDRSAESLRRDLCGVTVIETGRNLGFPAGCNLGIRWAVQQGADSVLLVNSDATLEPDAIGTLLAAWRAHPSAGILAPVLLSRMEPDRLESAGITYSMTTGRMRHPDEGRRVSALADGVRDVDAVSGCVMLLTRDVVERVGRFREEYFFSFEDVDLCLRARAAGFRTLCVPAARAYHEGHTSIGRRSPKRLYFATRNHLKMAADAGVSSPLTRLARGGWIVGLNAAYALTSADAPLVPGLAAVVRGAWHHFRGRYGPD